MYRLLSWIDLKWFWCRIASNGKKWLKLISHQQLHSKMVGKLGIVSCVIYAHKKRREKICIVHFCGQHFSKSSGLFFHYPPPQMLEIPNKRNICSSCGYCTLCNNMRSHWIISRGMRNVRRSTLPTILSIPIAVAKWMQHKIKKTVWTMNNGKKTWLSLLYVLVSSMKLNG